MPMTPPQPSSPPGRSSRAPSGSPRSGSSSTSEEPRHEPVLVIDRVTVGDPGDSETSGLVLSIRSRFRALVASAWERAEQAGSLPAVVTDAQPAIEVERPAD